VNVRLLKINKLNEIIPKYKRKLSTIPDNRQCRECCDPAWIAWWPAHLPRNGVSTSSDMPRKRRTCQPFGWDLLPIRKDDPELKMLDCRHDHKLLRQRFGFSISEKSKWILFSFF
jgi:hypothetical protein